MTNLWHPGGTAIVQASSSITPLRRAQGDRFVIRDVSAQRTLGGGRLLDLASAGAQKADNPSGGCSFRRLHFPTPCNQCMRCLRGASIFGTGELLFVIARYRVLGETQIALALALVILESDTMTIAIASGALERIPHAISRDAHSFSHGESRSQGMGRERLRFALVPRLPASVFKVALQMLAREGDIALDGAFIRLTSHAIRLTAEDEALWAKIVPLLVVLSGSARRGPVTSPMHWTGRRAT